MSSSISADVDRTGPLPLPATARLALWGIILMGGREGERAGAGMRRMAHSQTDGVIGARHRVGEVAAPRKW